MDKPEKIEIKHNLAKALDVNPLVIESTSNTTAMEPVTLSPEEELAKQDFETARANINDVISEGATVFGRLTAVAMRSEKARDFEVVAKLMDSLVDANHKLIELHEKRRGLVPDEEKPQEHVTNNTLVVGSAAELLDMIEQRKKLNNAPDNIYTNDNDD